jgi:glycosyltransferase involved in cell wall biosynthesis
MASAGVQTLLTDARFQMKRIDLISYAALQEATRKAQAAASGSGGGGWTSPVMPQVGETYGDDLMQQVERFAQLCVLATRGLKFDVIHAHDWLTYPAGIAIARITGKPLVVHVHSTEFDRSGAHVNQKVYDIERRGMHSAMRVIAVSQLTKNVAVRRYSVPEGKVDVVYNGVDIEPTQGDHRIGIGAKDKIASIGRITYQSGPSTSFAGARAEMMPTKFVVAVRPGGG